MVASVGGGWCDACGVHDTAASCSGSFCDFRGLHRSGRRGAAVDAHRGAPRPVQPDGPDVSSGDAGAHDPCRLARHALGRQGEKLSPLNRLASAVGPDAARGRNRVPYIRGGSGGSVPARPARRLRLARREQHHLRPLCGHHPTDTAAMCCRRVRVPRAAHAVAGSLAAIAAVGHSDSGAALYSGTRI